MHWWFFGLTGAFLLAMDAVLIVEATRQHSTFTIISAAAGVFGLGVNGAAGLLLVYAAREAGASFVVDDEGITRRAGAGRQPLPGKISSASRSFRRPARRVRLARGALCAL